MLNTRQVKTMQITRVNCPASKYSIKCPDVTSKQGIVVHNTANDASAMSEVSYMLGNGNKCSFHVAVDNYRVVECLPFDRSCYAAGDGRRGKGNARMINIEICYSKSGGQRFNEAEKLAAEYIAYLLKKYGWGIDKVTKHQDYSKKYCPHRTLDMGWQRFLNMIKIYLNNEIVANDSSSKNNDGSDEIVKTYQNGSTSETVFVDTACKNKIGSLDPREKCDCLGVFNNKAMVRYQVGSTGNYKIGFVKWLGGVK